MDIISKFPLGKNANFIALDPNANKAYVTENKENIISLIDFDSKTKTKLVNIERPRDLIFVPNLNRIYVIYGNAGVLRSGTGKKLCVIDVNAKQIIKDIGNKEGFGGIARNSITKKIYITQPHKKKVWIIDENSLEVEDKIDVKGKYRQIIVNENTNDLVLSGLNNLKKEELRIACYDFKSKNTKEIFSEGMTTIIGNYISILFSPKQNKIFANISKTLYDDAGTDSRIFSIDYAYPHNVNQIHSLETIFQQFDLDKENDFLYCLQMDGNNQYMYERQIVKIDLKSLTTDFFNTGLKYYSDFPNIFKIHPQTGHLLFFGIQNKQGYLFETSLKK